VGCNYALSTKEQATDVKQRSAGSLENLALEVPENNFFHFQVYDKSSSSDLDI